MATKRRSFDFRGLIPIARAEEFHDSRELSLHIGNRVQLNSGSAPGLVVDIVDNLITVAWPTGEAVFPRACIHRAL